MKYLPAHKFKSEQPEMFFLLFLPPVEFDNVVSLLSSGFCFHLQ